MTTTSMIPSPSAAPVPAGMLDDGQIALLKTTICKGATNEELALFVAQCRRTGLDPFVRQIHAVKRWSPDDQREVMTIQVGIDGLRLIADRTERYAPGEATLYEYDAGGSLVSATARVKKWVRGEWHVCPGTAHWDEYAQKTKQGAPTKMWQRMPHVMLGKCAEAVALRRAFPQETSGVYIHEEMMQADSEPAAPAVEDRRLTRDGTPAQDRTPAQARPQPPPSDLACAERGAALKPGQAAYSRNKFGRELCPVHQDNARPPVVDPYPADEQERSGARAGYEADPFTVNPALMDVPADDQVPSGIKG